MAWFAQTVVEGYVPSPSDAVQYTRSLLTSWANQLEPGLLAQQQAAFGRAGHALHGGHSWTFLKPRTIEIKTKLGFPRPAQPLYRTGEMSQKQRVQVRLEPFSGGLFFQVLAMNTAWYSRFHQSGFRHVWSGNFVPARMPVELTGQDLQFVVESLRGFMAGSTVVAKRNKFITLRNPFGKRK